MKYILMEKMSGSNSEKWISDLSMKEAKMFGLKSDSDIVRIYSDNQEMKLIKTLKEPEEISQEVMKK